MAILSKGTDFSTGDQVTAANLDALVDSATFASGAVDNTTTALDSSSPQKIIVKDGGIGTTQLATDAVTAAKIAAGALTDVVYPVGSIFTTVNNYANSAAVVNAIGGTTWSTFGSGRVLVGQKSSDSNFNTVEETGGASTVTLSQPEMNHTHQWNKRISDTNTERNFIKMEDVANTNRDVSFDASGNNQDYTDEFELRQNTFTSVNQDVSGGSVTAHNNLQPYVVVYMWKRTA